MAAIRGAAETNIFYSYSMSAPGRINGSQLVMQLAPLWVLR